MRHLLILAIAAIALAGAGCLPFGAGAVVETLTGPQPTPEPPAPIVIQPPSVNITVPVINASGGDMPAVKANRQGVDVTPPAPQASQPAEGAGTILHEGTIRHEGSMCTYKLPDGRVIDCADIGDHVEWVSEGK